MRRDPAQFGHALSRWTLHSLLDSCHERGWLPNLTTLGGLHQLLDRIGIAWKMGRQHVYSPDRAYEAKVEGLKQVLKNSTNSMGRIVTVYMDQVTTYRQPTLARAYEQKGVSQPLAERSYKSDTITRIVASLEHESGKVVYLRASRIGICQLVEFYTRLRAAYPQAERIYVVQDNWPVHVHPDVLVALEPQETGWLRAVPPNWPTTPGAAARRKWGDLQLPIQAVPLPTYASWLNPIEKLWRWLKQNLLHMHRLADDLALLRAGIDHFLDQFANGSQSLLRYVGLCDG